LYFDVYPLISQSNFGDGLVDIRDILQVLISQGSCSGE